MKTITILKAVFFMTLTVLILPFYGCSILYNPLSFSEKNKEPILMSSQQALEYLAKKNIFLQQVYLVFDLQNQLIKLHLNVRYVPFYIKNSDIARNIFQKLHFI